MAKVIEGVNDLATLRPDLLEFWCYEKNNELGIFPNKITIHSDIVVFYNNIGNLYYLAIKLYFGQIWVLDSIFFDSVSGGCHFNKKWIS